MPDNIMLLPGCSGEYDPRTFLGLVQRDIDRSGNIDVVSTIALVLTADGAFTIHTSSTDRERNLSLLAVAHLHATEEMRNALTYGFEPDDEGDLPPAA